MERDIDTIEVVIPADGRLLDRVEIAEQEYRLAFVTHRVKDIEVERARRDLGIAEGALKTAPESIAFQNTADAAQDTYDKAIDARQDAYYGLLGARNRLESALTRYANIKYRAGD